MDDDEYRQRIAAVARRVKQVQFAHACSTTMSNAPIDVARAGAATAADAAAGAAARAGAAAGPGAAAGGMVVKYCLCQRNPLPARATNIVHDVQERHAYWENHGQRREEIYLDTRCAEYLRHRRTHLEPHRESVRAAVEALRGKVDYPPEWPGRPRMGAPATEKCCCCNRFFVPGELRPQHRRPVRALRAGRAAVRACQPRALRSASAAVRFRDADGGVGVDRPRYYYRGFGGVDGGTAGLCWRRRR
jgi:hypothetical protein